MIILLYIIIFAIVQGISEFLPISSSAHLIILRDILKIGNNIINKDIALTFDISLHLGTLIAIFIMFRKEFFSLIKSAIKIKEKNDNKKLFLNIIVATIPAALIGILFEDYIDNFIRQKYLIIAISLIIMGIIIYFVDITHKEIKNIYDLTFKDALIIGISQSFALIPGFSRSGTTIASSRILNIDKESSAKFSFFLSFPIILGAVVLQLLKIDYIILFENLWIFSLGILVSFITGIICIKAFISYLKNNNFKIFMYYRLILGIAIILYLLIKYHFFY